MFSRKFKNTQILQKVELFCNFCPFYEREELRDCLENRCVYLVIPLFNATARLSVTVRARHQLNELAFSQSSHTQLFPGRKIKASWPAASLVLVHHLIAECRSGLSTCLLPPSAVSSFSSNKHNANCVLPVPNFPNQNR